MLKEVSDSREERVPLSRERVLNCAVAVADAGGLGSLTMRSLAKELGVKPMALYHYFANKDEILDGIVDLVFGEMDLPSVEGHWRAEITRRAASARTGAAAPPLGDHAHGVALHTGPRHAAAPRRRARHAAGSRPLRCR